MTDTFVWERCTPDLGSGCADIPGSSQTVPEGTQAARTSTGDIGYRLRARGYRNGVLIGESDPTGVVAAQSDIWQWDARAATRSASQSPASYVKSHIPAAGAIFGAEVAIVFPSVGVPTVAVVDPFGPTKNIQIPVGSKHGPTTDAHLGVVQTDEQHFGMWRVNNADFAHPGGVGRVAPGGVFEDRPASGSNAAYFDLTAALVTADDLASGVPHALTFGIPTSAVAGVPCKYPSNAVFNDSRCVYGQWLGLDPHGVVPNYGGDVLLEYIDLCLRECGMFNRDQAPSGLSIFGMDYINQDPSPPSVWAAAGVTMTLASGAAYNWARYLTSGAGVQIPWSQLQALDPPSP